ncbi:phage minor head protein [Chelatococcus sp. SYSU_G07232]|uniref:Phage minor head protein n=1 Tax=Chelatococcus albus TaxID=3047466 RepID=A0ABT7AC05_9HYPH|nr:phage minor head protein [Chelatococcus sp. SYSU_G07232]MDJ1156889.1 phage minor head protein [Chelatococcus sp. SYSU_G07232]
MLDDIRAALRKAVVDRVPFEQFRKELEPILQSKGWWGKREVTDPKTGERVTAQLGSVRRLELIYDANIRSAEAAGDWQRIQRVKDALPYLEYMTSTSERKRPLHLSWVGTTLPVDDPWWATHYPPNGWRCKCRVRSRAVPREGASTRRPPLKPQPWTNPATGETRMVPAGIDPGWDHNPGRARAQMVGRRLTERLDRMGGEARREAVRRLREDPVFTYVARNGSGFRRLDRSPDNVSLGHLRWPAAVMPDRLAAMLDSRSRVVTASVADGAKIIEKHGIDLTEFPLQEALDAPEVVVADGKLSLLATWRGKRYIVVIKRSQADELFINSIHRITDQQARKLEEAAGGA